MSEVLILHYTRTHTHTQMHRHTHTQDKDKRKNTRSCHSVVMPPPNQGWSLVCYFREVCMDQCYTISWSWARYAQENRPCTPTVPKDHPFALVEQSTASGLVFPQVPSSLLCVGLGRVPSTERAFSPVVVSGT